MSTSRKLILHVGNGTTVEMDSPTTFGAIVRVIRKALGFLMTEFQDLSDIVKIYKLVFYKATCNDHYGISLSPEEYANTAQITADNIYWRKAIKIYSYGEGVGKGVSSKHYLCLVFNSSFPPENVVEQLNSFENRFGVGLGLSEADASQKPPPNVGRPLRIVCIPISKTSNRAVPAEDASVKDFVLHKAHAELGDYMLFYVAAKTSYSHTTEYQIRKLMNLPAVPESGGTDYCDRLLSTMTGTDLQKFQNDVDGYLDALKLSADRAQRWNSCVRLCFDHLFALQPHFAVLSDYNEATRRLIVNEIMQAATMYCNSTLGVEDVVWKQSISMKFENVCGYGPLDYSTSTTPQSALEKFIDARGVVYDTVAGAAGVTTDMPKLPCSPVSCSYATLPPYTPTPYERTVTSLPTNSASSSTSNASSPTVFPAVIKMDPLIPSEQISDFEQKKQGMDVEDEDDDTAGQSVEEEEEEEGVETVGRVKSRSFSINPNAIPLSHPPEEKKLFKTLSKAKRWNVVMKLLKSLWQTLGELHDLHLDPCTEVSSSVVGTLGGSNSSSTDQPAAVPPQNAGISHRTVYGTLTSGQTYHFFRSDWSVGESKPTVTYLGRLTLSVLIYHKDDQPAAGGGPTKKMMKLNDGTAAVTSSAPVTANPNEEQRLSRMSIDDSGGYNNRVSYEQFQRVVAATVMMMEGSLRGAKEL